MGLLLGLSIRGALGLRQAGQLDQCFRLFEQMKQKGVEPSQA